MYSFDFDVLVVIYSVQFDFDVLVVIYSEQFDFDVLVVIIWNECCGNSILVINIYCCNLAFILRTVV